MTSESAGAVGDDDLQFAQTVQDEDRFDLEAEIELAEYNHDDIPVEWLMGDI